MLLALALALAGPSADGRTEAAEARVAELDRQYAAQRAAWRDAQAPLARLLAAIERIALRPPALALAQPRSIDDLIHTHALLAAVRPIVAARAAAVRQQLADTRVASAEAARILAERSVALSGYEKAQSARLMTLPAPPDTPAARPAAIYDLPAHGMVVSGTGERIDGGWRARGLTLLTAPGARVIAPAAGRIAYAGAFGGYGGIVIIDHGRGWTTLLTGLDHTLMQSGVPVVRGAAVGQMSERARRLTIELRHDGRPVDVAGMSAQ
ncbi:murein hydrolase activator EnvC family protein [Sphingomonas sp. MMS24-J13]|uniref:murein hydrolase activator EnvC family protein n=1 Tax=Sphingomonas sp. MMS24-J13 TaxID=3238686 RepID=UPI00384EB141